MNRAADATDFVATDAQRFPRPAVAALAGEGIAPRGPSVRIGVAGETDPSGAVGISSLTIRRGDTLFNVAAIACLLSMAGVA